MTDEDSFADDMARELDATICMLAEWKSALAAALGTEQVCKLEEYRAGRLDSSAEQERAEFERWLDSRDSEWLMVVGRMRHMRDQRAALGRLCMRLNTSDKRAK
ncbi:MAG: hypothetical protein HHJ12_17780 [Glaciimonas sp.]|nr:hypothetical protein [Glaciimonas sp.]